MNIIALGGWMMWPLLAVSILTLTVIVERLLLYASCSLPEARALIESKRVRPLLLMADKPDGVFPDVPLLNTQIDTKWVNGAWRGIVGPKGLPAEISSTLETALKKISDSAAYQDFLKQRGFGSLYANGADFAAFMARDEQAKGEVMKAVGLAK